METEDRALENQKMPTEGSSGKPKAKDQRPLVAITLAIYFALAKLSAPAQGLIEEIIAALGSMIPDVALATLISLIVFWASKRKIRFATALTATLVVMMVIQFGLLHPPQIGAQNRL